MCYVLKNALATNSNIEIVFFTFKYSNFDYFLLRPLWISYKVLCNLSSLKSRSSFSPRSNDELLLKATAAKTLVNCGDRATVPTLELASSTTFNTV